MVYKYNKNIRRISRILDAFHDRGFDDDAYCISIDDDTKRVQLYIMNSELTKSMLRKEQPNGWWMQETEIPGHLKINCVIKFDQAGIGDCLDSLYYWIESAITYQYTDSSEYAIES